MLGFEKEVKQVKKVSLVVFDVIRLNATLGAARFRIIFKLARPARLCCRDEFSGALMIHTVRGSIVSYGV